ncbi:MAG TPA: flagellar basal body P-ring protein FlgI [Planctomycetia bacterium]|nr:flagellar basal body P-ring protein FlgI [Planctomycetia bacterium]
MLHSFATVLALAGALSMPAEDEAEKKKNANDYPVVGDFTRVHGLEPIKVEGLGLVVGLSDTGGDPPPGYFRDRILEEMRKRDVHQPEKLLASKQVSAVVLRAYVPAGVRKNDKIDVEVYTIPGDDRTVSLKGGRLLPSELSEVLLTKKGVLGGKKIVKVEGPVLINEGPAPRGQTEAPRAGAVKDEGEVVAGGAPEDVARRSGRVLGQGVVQIDRDFIVTINREHRGGRRAKELASFINYRFHTNDKDGRQIGLAKAKDDRQVELVLAEPYRLNYFRYLNVVRRIPMIDPSRIGVSKTLHAQLLSPATSYEAALRLEALGPASVTALKDGLGHPSQLVRFAAAEALAYLGDGRAINELSGIAEKEPLYRPYALAGLASLRQPAAKIKLMRLLHSPGAETRYGAFRSLFLMDSDELALGGEKVADDVWLHVIESKSEPMIHVARNFRPEIVLFNADQVFKAPMMLRIGEHLIVSSDKEGKTVFLASIKPGQRDPLRAESGPKVADVLKQASKLGATYPECVELLRQAAAQNNLWSADGAMRSRLEINALPRAVTMNALVKNARAEEDAAALPTGLPSMFQEGGEQSSNVAFRGAVEEDSSKPEAKKKGFWERLKFWGN